MVENTKVWGYSLIGLAVLLLIILSLVKADSDTKDTALCEAYHEGNLDMKNCPAHTSNVSWFIMASFGISFLILGIGVYMLFMKPTMDIQRKSYKSLDVATLNDEEKKIYSLIKEKEGSAYQADLIKETGFSKVKMSRILDRLETKGILERKRRGMTNIIVLK